MIVFGKEVLKESSVTGEKSNRYRDKDGKPPLDPVKLQLIYSKIFVKIYHFHSQKISFRTHGDEN